MFSLNHILWICICVVMITVSLIVIRRNNIPLQRILPVCCVISAVSEAIKTFSVFKVVPSSDGSTYYPYFELQYLPLHMCSLLIFVIFYCTLGTNERWKNILLGIMYPMSLLGGISTIILPSIFLTSISASEAFVHPIAYQTFIYHSMLVVLGITIVWDRNSGLTSRNFRTTLISLSTLAFASLYLNSMFATPVYKDSVLQSVEYTTNFFFTYRTPIGMQLTGVREWLIYLAILCAATIIFIYVCYIPIFRREKIRPAQGSEEQQTEKEERKDDI